MGTGTEPLAACEAKQAAPSSVQFAECARHPGARATIICSRCGSYACEVCRQMGPAGVDYCGSCVPERMELARVGTRFVANMVDNILVVLVLFFGVVLLVPLSRSSPELGLAMAGLAMLGLLGYQMYLAHKFGQSIGKRLLNIRTVRSDGSRASLWRIVLLRNVVPQVLNSSCGVVGLVDALMIFGSRRRCLHDFLADTIVVEVNR